MTYDSAEKAYFWDVMLNALFIIMPGIDESTEPFGSGETESAGAPVISAFFPASCIIYIVLVVMDFL